MKLIIIESPYAGDIEANTEYARRCMLHSLRLGEAPIVSHLLYPQVLNERLAEERLLGIKAGLAWRRVAELRVFYTDRGWSKGMVAARSMYDNEKLAYEERSIEAVPHD